MEDKIIFERGDRLLDNIEGLATSGHMSLNTLNDDELAEELLQKKIVPVHGKRATSLITDRKILVTGAGGSIGSEIVRQIKKIDPFGRTYFIDNNEYALYTLQLSLTGKPLLTEPEYLLADITDSQKIEKIFQEIKPDIVFHAAAYKQLPLLEKFPEGAINTNVFGTLNIAKACRKNNVEFFINISTDKAARPTSVLGMTKRLAEKIVANNCTPCTKTASVRFGNVLGSRGSFVETLKYQFANGLPITLTNIEMSRYFMSVPEAAGLVIEAATMADNGSTLILDMGLPIKIIDLVNRFSEITKINPVKILVSGSRPGEKLEEELVDPMERLNPTVNPKIQRVKALLDEDLEAELSCLRRALSRDYSSSELKAILQQIVIHQEPSLIEGEEGRRC